VAATASPTRDAIGKWQWQFAESSLAASITLAIATIALRLPLMAPRLAHWDAVNYALGLHNFDIAAHQPHPPGSPYFILLGRAALAFVGDDNAALELISVLASAGAVIVEFLLAKLLFGRRAALLAALLLLTQPVLWGYGTTASAWTVLALCSIGIAYMAARLLRGQTHLVYPSAVLVGVVSGFRADAAMFLAPLWLWGLFSATRGWRTRVVAIAVMCGSALVWLVPVTLGAGGPRLWSERLLALLPTSDAATPRHFAANTAIAFGTLAFTLGPVLMAWLISRKPARLESRTRVFLGLLVVPAFTFLWLVDSTEPGHDLVFVGAVALLGGALLQRSVALAVAVAVLQSVVFLFAAPLSDRPLAWTMNSILLNVTAPGLRAQQSSLDDTLVAIRDRFDPAGTVVVTVVGQDPYRFMMYYLPEYTVVRLDAQTRAVLSAHGREQGNWQEATCLTADNAVLVLSTMGVPGTIPSDAIRLTEAGEPFEAWQLPTPRDYLGFAIGRCA
jgi:hypothetical protein